MDDPSTVATMLAAAVPGIASAAANAIANAVKASGAIVRVEPEDFCRILSEADAPLVVICPGGKGSRKIKYLTSWKGFVFHCVSKIQLNLPGNSKVIAAKKIWIPS